MTDWFKRVSGKISKLSSDQVEQLFEVLIEENETFDAVLNSLKMAVMVCDGNFLVFKVNKAAERMLSFVQRISEMRSREVPLWDLIGEPEIADFMRTIHRKGQTNVCREFTVATSGGSVKFLVVTVIPLVRGRRVEGNIVSVDDVTESRRQEVLVRRMEKLEDLTTLAANVAHEIKNPLAGLSIHIQLLQKSIAKARREAGVLPQEKFVESYISVVNEEIDRLNGIVNDFLFAVRPIKAEYRLLDPNELLRQCMDFCRPELEGKGIQLQMDLMEGPPKLMLDDKLFRQVVLNLVQNAIAALSPAPGSGLDGRPAADDEGRLLWVNTQVKSDFFVLSMADNGCGMGEETAARIFEPYFTTKTTGTGLGLTMVYKIVKEFSGDIQVKSLVGEGTVFTVSLPIPQLEQRLLEYRS